MLHILKLTVSGLPQAWLTLEEAVLHYATGQVLWEAGSEIAALHGGHNAISGLRSEVRVNSIIGVNGMGKVNPFDIVPSLSNSKLFQRDRNICAYCGDQFPTSALEREHIVPLSRGGRDSWMNVVASCRSASSSATDCRRRRAKKAPRRRRPRRPGWGQTLRQWRQFRAVRSWCISVLE